MPLLLASLAFADDNAAAIGLLGVPETPADAKPRGTHAERMEAIRSGERPERLVPFHYEDHGRRVSGTLWHDGLGDVYTREEAMAILVADPASAAEAKRARGLRTGALVLAVTGLVAEIPAIVLAPPAAPLIVATDAVVLEGGGLTLDFVGRSHMIAAAKAYNLAHAPAPALPES